MVRPINRNILSLGVKSTPATKADISVGDDLLETLNANLDACVGMAANMIGVHKRIIVFHNGLFPELMFNPEIIAKSGKYETEEGCLSLVGVRPCTRYENITVKYQDRSFKWVTRNFTGYTAEIIQHEIDHCNGIII